MREQRYILIFGCGTKLGIQYALFLAQKGFNLVLVDVSKERLTDCENKIKTQIHEMIDYRCICLEGMNKGIDESYLLQKLSHIPKFSLDCFINCWSVYRSKPQSANPSQTTQKRALSPESQRLNNYEALVQYELMRKLFESQAEILAQLIYFIHRQLIASPLQTAVLNVKRREKRGEQSIGFSLKSEQICRIFQATSQGFNMVCGHQLKRRFNRKVKCLSIKVDYSRQEDVRYLDKKVIQSFQLLNYHM